jgi:threonylcarbamoyladenosine tRNA methylthiotransferase MtaB
LRQVPQLARLRISSIDSIEVDDALMEIIASEPRFMPHLHLSLQHGDNLILKRMKRRHMREDSIRFCTDIRRLRPDIIFGADFIAGFPTETKEMFENTLRLVDECGLTHLHVFPFSARPGTPAARMPQLDRKLVKERAARLRAAGDHAYGLHLAGLTGKTVNVLIERDSVGRSEQFTPVHVAKAPETGIVCARITGSANGMALGELTDMPIALRGAA